jgi:cysteine desulfurase
MTGTREAIYLDHHATTPCDPAVVAAMLPWFTEHFGNAGSKQHAWGMRASSAVELAREQVAAAIGARPGEVVFTSGATESDNLAVVGAARAAAGRHLITCTAEHHAVLDPMRRLAEEGWALTELAPAADGRVDAAQVAAALRPDTALVSLMLGNNEIGAIHPIAEIGALCRARGVLLHTDAVQALGRIPIDVGALGVDLMSLTAHKAYGPKGVGALWVREGVEIDPLVRGGGQERGVRSGTLPVPLIVGFGRAATIAVEQVAAGEAERQRALAARLWDGLAAAGDVVLNGPPVASNGRLPGNLHVSFERVASGALLGALRPIALSAGSACGSGRSAPSHVLTAIGQPAQLARGAIRFGLGRSTTEAQIDHVVARVVEAVAAIRRGAGPG